ncbi:MAG: PQQ-binding-like beta-propeller repeat protein [Gemmatimonas sp.]|nr:PQQ-binding-like beta-propeller repeat protein [Gemmatimonas sp.]
MKMMTVAPWFRWQRMLGYSLLLAIAVPATDLPAAAQERGTPVGEWRYQSADAWGTRYSPLDQINAENFGDLEVAWQWRGDNFGDHHDPVSRSTPSYIDGKLYTVAGYRRQVVSIDPATGETLWTYREPNTERYERSMRSNYGKGVAYAEIDGRNVIYMVSPAFFLHALDAETGRPLAGFGSPVPVEGFPETGVVDLLADLGHEYDPYGGIPREVGMITSSSPPIVVNDVVVVGNSAEQGYNQTRIENVPGDILAYDARTGEHLWKFNVIPRPGEFGHETWENDAWEWTGDVSSWAPMSADVERGIVYIPTNPPTVDYYGGFRPGDGLFGTSVIALDVQTGQRVWHFQTVRHDIWNYDLPGVPVLADLNVDGQEIPAVIQPTKQGMLFAFNRETGEPVWPIEERPVPESEVPGEQLSPTQPFPTRPEPLEKLGITEDDLIDYTPELHQAAVETFQEYRVGGPYEPPLHVGHDAGVKGSLSCSGGINITHPVTMDPETNIMYLSSGQGCSSRMVTGGEELDLPNDPMTTGQTISDWVAGPSAGFPGPEGLPIYKPPYSRITAIDMDTGEHLWWVPAGETPDRIANHPSLQGVDLPNTGTTSRAILMTTGSLLLAATMDAAENPILIAHDKATGERIANIDLPARGQYGMMTYLHEGKQYIVVQIASDDMPGSLVALTLPEE